jgi:alpha-1,6-mannosyltransferase
VTVLVGVGRLAREKRWDVILDAFGRIATKTPAVLVLFGDGPERTRLAQRAPPGVIFAGFERDRGRLAGALASADLLVHACPCETFGLSIAEAVACGLPVVVPDEGGARESAPRGSSETYAALDPAACAAAIERLLADDPDDRRRRALAAAPKVPTAADHIAHVLAAYADLRARC